MISDRPRLVVLLSGGGRTLQNFLDRTGDGRMDGCVVGVVSSKAGVRGLERARRAGAPAVVVERAACADDDEFGRRVADAADAWRPDLILMAGLIHFCPIPPAWDGRVLNIHPALLPRFGGRGFYGDHVHRAVLAAGERVSGCTVHYVDNIYDHGPHIVHRSVPVLEGDTVRTLADRVFDAECATYPEGVAMVWDLLCAEGGA